MERQLQTPQGQLFNNFVSGAVGGFVGTAINTPFDVRLGAVPIDQEAEAFIS